MILKKSLKRGQATLEYFLLFTAVIFLTLLTLGGTINSFFGSVRDTAQGTSATPGYAQKGFDAIINADNKVW